MEFKDILPQDILAFSDELHLRKNDYRQLLKLWKHRKMKKLRKALLSLSTAATRGCYTSVAGLRIRELAEESKALL